MVEVKRLRDLNFTGAVQFQTEVEMIGLALHKNLMRLYGFYMEPGVRILVYPYMPNGSVEDHLRGLGCYYKGSDRTKTYYNNQQTNREDLGEKILNGQPTTKIVGEDKRYKKKIVEKIKRLSKGNM